MATQTIYVPTRAAEKYIRSIRNSAKRAYAQAYYQYILDGRLTPNGPEYDNSTLSYMCAQAVRMNLDEIYSS